MMQGEHSPCVLWCDGSASVSIDDLFVPGQLTCSYNPASYTLKVNRCSLVTLYEPPCVCVRIDKLK